MKFSYCLSLIAIISRLAGISLATLKGTRSWFWIGSFHEKMPVFIWSPKIAQPLKKHDQRRLDHLETYQGAIQWFSDGIRRKELYSLSKETFSVLSSRTTERSDLFQVGIFFGQVSGKYELAMDFFTKGRECSVCISLQDTTKTFGQFNRKTDTFRPIRTWLI